jgi:hypothetical protein
MATDVNTYVYLIFLRMSLHFFLALALVNLALLVPLYATGTAQSDLYQTVLPRIQRVTIANIIGDQLRLSLSFVVGLANWAALCLFIWLFKGKIDDVQSTQL